MKPGGGYIRALSFHAEGPGFDHGAGQGWLSHLSLKWFDKISTKFAWELNTKGQVDYLTRAYATASPGDMVWKAEFGALIAYVYHRL